jgi:hypothetical protein
MFPKALVLSALLLVALVAFEIFNYDTTRFALESLLGEVSFLGISWATILAIAFCAIDFAGLARLFTPEQGQGEPRAVWYLMGAWLLGATMNAMMTWWAVNLVLLGHELGNEVLAREQLLRIVPLMVAVLVWLTRILFIGAFSVAGDHLFERRERRMAAQQGARTGQELRMVRKQSSDHRPQSANATRQVESGIPAPTFVRNTPPKPASVYARSRR